MIRRALALIGALVASDAAALSCARPDLAQSFARAEAVSETVYLLRGTLTFDTTRLPEMDALAPDPDPAPIPARFEGFALNAGGFTTPYAQDVTLQPRCLGPWCGGAESGEEAIMFATVTDKGLVIEAWPCGGQIFYDVTPQMVRQAQACFNGSCPLR